MTRRLQQAISQAVENHPGLKNKAFEMTRLGLWTIREDVVKQYYSTTEAILVGLLVEIYNRCHGLPFDWDYIDGPGQHIWNGASEAANLFDMFDDDQQKIIKTLLAI